MKKKPISILKREAISSKGKSANFKAATKKRKSSLSVGSAGAEEVYLARPAKRRLGPPTVGGVATKHAKWFCYSYVDRDAASILGKILTAKKAGLPISQIKALTLAPNIREKKATHAVVCKTLEHLPLIEKTATASGLLANPDLAKETAYVLVYEVLFGQGCKPVGPAERAVLSAKRKLQEHLRELEDEAGGNPSSSVVQQPTQVQQAERSARVNLLKGSVSEALSWLRKPPPPHDGLARLGQGVRQDELLDDVLLFPAGTDLHDHPLVADSRLILQSRSSCMAAHALRPAPGWTVMDACAAPGNKTTHLAALVGSEGKVLAYDKDATRVERLERNLAAAGAKHAEAHVADFTALDLTDSKYSAVKALLLDPSCSGSGTKRRRLDHLLPGFGQEDKAALSQRLQGLAKFQEAALRHAFSLPSLQRLVYSTCSVHREENEDVVAAVLPLAEELGFHLVDPFPSWPRRGLPVLAGSELLVRVDEEKDGTDGFFIAVFERLSCEPRAPSEEADCGRVRAREERARRDTPGGGEKIKGAEGCVGLGIDGRVEKLGRAGSKKKRKQLKRSL